MLRGQCLCGAIQYHYDAELKETIICHCLDCQKAQGSAFGFNSPIEKQYFRLEQGVEALQEFFFTPNKARVFCRLCGSPIYSYRKDLPDILRLRLGTVTAGKIPAPNQEYFIQHRLDFLLIALK